MINNGIDDNQYIAWAIALKNDPILIGTISFWNVKYGTLQGRDRLRTTSAIPVARSYERGHEILSFIL